MKLKDILIIIKAIIFLFIIYSIGYAILHYPLYFILGVGGLIIFYFIILVIKAAIMTYQDMKKINNKKNKNKIA